MGTGNTIGTVYWVGAGPGDQGLLTLRGRALLGGSTALPFSRNGLGDVWEWPML